MLEGGPVRRFPKHFDGKRFFNPDSPPVNGFLDLLKWKLTTRPERGPAFVADVKPTKPPAEVSGEQLRVTLVNHSTVLFQQAGLHILTDPVWSRRVSPLTWIGPSRRRDPGVQWDDLPRIDVVLLSHNHYDHLDLATLRRLAERGQSQFIVPTGVSPLLKSNGISPVDEMDWGESVKLPLATIHSVPALHFSARGLHDRNRTLWCGYMIESGDRMVYFAGDTAFGAHFASIREQFGPPRLALLPIGAYEPRWFMGPVHMPPEDALKAHQILGAKTSIAIHHGTFQLADEGIDTPRKVLSACGVPDSFIVLDNGQSLTIDGDE